MRKRGLLTCPTQHCVACTPPLSLAFFSPAAHHCSDLRHRLGCVTLFCHRAFALATPSACSALSLSSVAWLKCNLLRGRMKPSEAWRRGGAGPGAGDGAAPLSPLPRPLLLYLRSASCLCTICTVPSIWGIRPWPGDRLYIEHMLCARRFCRTMFLKSVFGELPASESTGALVKMQSARPPI